MDKFDRFFKDIYQERWESLKSSLQTRHKQVRRSVFQAKNLQLSAKDIFELPLHQADQFEMTQETNEQGLKKYYIMDPASILCAQSLEIEAGDHVLDMCAAPGGKTLILLEKIIDGILWSNEISSNRRGKLKSVVHS